MSFCLRPAPQESTQYIAGTAKYFGQKEAKGVRLSLGHFTIGKDVLERKSRVWIDALYMNIFLGF